MDILSGEIEGVSVVSDFNCCKKLDLWRLREDMEVVNRSYDLMHLLLCGMLVFKSEIHHLESVYCNCLHV